MKDSRSARDTHQRALLWRASAPLAIGVVVSAWQFADWRTRVADSAAAETIDRDLGATLEPMPQAGATQVGRGLVLTSLAANGPAAAAGLRPGDVLQLIGNDAISDPRVIAHRLAGTPPPWRVIVIRGGQPREMLVGSGHPAG
jgi:S1-C subfamily serine protease